VAGLILDGFFCTSFGGGSILGVIKFVKGGLRIHMTKMRAPRIHHPNLVKNHTYMTRGRLSLGLWIRGFGFGNEKERILSCGRY